jgi:hypothetical protein
MSIGIIVEQCDKFAVVSTVITYILIFLSYWYHSIFLTYLTLYTFSISLMFMFMLGIKQNSKLDGDQ